MRTISLWEPWGTAIAKGLKKIETRGWSTNWRGPLAIHCAKTRDHAAFIHNPEVREYFQGVDVFLPCKLPFGCVVATCVLVDVKPTADIREIVTPMERAFGNYDAGRFGWVLEQVTPLATPLPWKGSQGFFDVPDNLLHQRTDPEKIEAGNRLTRTPSPAERQVIEELYRRKNRGALLNGYVTTAAPVPMGGKDGKSPWESAAKVIPAGKTLKIVMVSRFDDAGLTDNLDAEYGYGVRLDWNDAAMTDIRLCREGNAS